MRLALYLLLYTGQREIDVIAMKWTDVQRRGDVDMIHVVQQKTGSKVWIPIHPKLAALLAKTPRPRVACVSGLRIAGSRMQ